MLSTPLCGCARTDENVLIIIAELTSRLSTLPTLDTYRVSLNNASVVGWDSLESMMPPSFSTIGVIGDAMEIYQYLRSCLARSDIGDGASIAGQGIRHSSSNHLGLHASRSGYRCGVPEVEMVLVRGMGAQDHSRRVGLDE